MGSAFFTAYPFVVGGGFTVDNDWRNNITEDGVMGNLLRLTM